MASIICPHCGTTNRRGAEFCGTCGTDLRAERPPLPLSASDSVPAAAAPGQPGEEQAQPAAELPNLAAPAAPLPVSEDPLAQPWLQPGFVGADDVPFEVEEEDLAAADMTIVPPPVRLVGGIQGLLDPVRVTALGGGAGIPGLPPPAGLEPEQVRRVRTLMAEEPLLASAARGRPRRGAALRNFWIFLIIGLAVALPVLLHWQRPTGEPVPWPGVLPVYRAVERLTPDMPVLVLWAYDPATAGELDVVATPVLRHLLTRGARLVVFTLLPNGPATARRVIAQVQRELNPHQQSAGEPLPADVVFLPGGVTVLPLVGEEQAPLAIVFAAQAQDVQQWLEQVQPQNRVPTAAVTAAGAAPLVQPYVDSGQLTGLVSGYDGAYAYTQFMGEARGDALPLERQIVGQNYGLLAFLAIVVLGNVAAIVTGRRRDG